MSEHLVALPATERSGDTGDECTDEQRECGTDRRGGCGLAGRVRRLPCLQLSRLYLAHDPVYAHLGIGLRNAAVRRNELSEIAAILGREPAICDPSGQDPCRFSASVR